MSHIIDGEQKDKEKEKKKKKREEHISCKTIIETKLHIANKTPNIKNRDQHSLASVY